MKSVQKLWSSLGAAAVLLALAVAVAFWAFARIEASADARRSSFLEIRSANDLLSSLKDAETAQRGYVLTGDEKFLTSYTAVVAGFKGQLKDLHELAMSAESDREIDAMLPLIDAKVAEMAQVIELRRQQGLGAAQAMVESGLGQRLMDSIRQQMLRVVQTEEAALARHNAELKVNLRRMFAILVAASVLTLLSALAFAYLFHQRSRQGLKNLVHLETQHLLAAQEQTNAQLQHSNMALQDGEQKLAVTLSSIGDAVIATDTEARVTLLNPVAQALTGWTLTQATGRPVEEIFNIINKETRRSVTLPIMAALKHGAVQGMDNHTVLIARNGSECDISDSCAPIRNHHGEVIGAVLVFRDVSKEYSVQHALSIQRVELESQNNELRQSQIALDLLRARYFDLYDLAPVGYCTVSEAGLIMEANLTAATLVGLTKIALVKQRFSRFIDPGGADTFHLMRKRVLESGEPQACEIRMLRSSGAQFWVHLATSAARDDGDRVIRVVISDIDERKRAEQALVKADALQNAIFNSANFSSIATDAQGVIQIFNGGAERMLGYAAQDVVNQKTPADISDPQESIERARALSTELGTAISPGFEALVFKASRGIEDIYELTYIRKDGSRFPALLSVTALRDASEGIIGYLLIGSDNTARQRIETERMRFEKALQDKNAELEAARLAADQANLAKSDFLSSMSHELRTPLSAILGFAQLIESGSPALSDSQRRGIEQILKAGWYLLDLINEVLDLAMIESGKLSLSMEPVALHDVMLECQAMVEPQASSRQVHVTFMPTEPSYYVHADRTRVKQVLINLLSNAIKYNKVGGTVHVEYRLSPPDAIRISVRDSGCGMSPQQLEQLFQPFNRLGQQSKVEEGTGIGLVVCKRLVELMNGRIGFESTVGQGSVFWFEIAASHEPGFANFGADFDRALPTPLPGSSTVHTLLYVEDNPANLMLVEDLVARRPDIRLLSARDGYRGIVLARSALPDVILMDINLPGISGLKALSILAQDPATAHIPVLALSANAIPRDIEKGLEAGFFRYLTKPIKVNEFMDALDVAMRFSSAQAQLRIKKEPTP